MSNPNKTWMKGPQNINNMSKEYEFSGYKLADEINIVILTVIYLFGVVGNMFVIYIYSRKTIFSSFNIYRISLAMCELFSCIVNASQMPLLYWYKIQEIHGSVTYIKTLNLMLWLVAVLHSFHLVLISVDRCKAAYKHSIYRPKKTNVVCKILLIYIASILLALLFAIMQFLLSRPLAKIFLTIVTFIVALIFVLILTVCYTAIVLKLVAVKLMVNPMDYSKKQTSDHNIKAENAGSSRSNPGISNTR